ncbi:hypothetical protein PsorP6_006749 [Peronosclerospora sorghi]|uniref:Uncharacterized protein n=1 Tax=Peronosclerospora sorghi TaxID=230839 RepID=A0ACC0W121_9STRA|nr:hypothetical protein PsorP6_006749 [Peronosclerospora sorghi]
MDNRSDALTSLDTPYKLYIHNPRDHSNSKLVHQILGFLSIHASELGSDMMERQAVQMAVHDLTEGIGSRKEMHDNLLTFLRCFKELLCVCDGCVLAVALSTQFLNLLLHGSLLCHGESCCRHVFSPSRMDRPVAPALGTSTASDHPTVQRTASRRTDPVDAPADGLRSVLSDDAEDPALPAVVTFPSSLLILPPPPSAILPVPSCAIMPLVDRTGTSAGKQRDPTAPLPSSIDGFND